MKPLTPEAIILCDDIRHEISGKHTIVGTFGGGIVTTRLPFNLIAAWWIQVRVSEAGRYDYEFRIISKDDAQLLAGNFGFDARMEGVATLPLPKFQIQIQNVGLLRLQWRPRGTEQWETVKEIAVTLNPNAFAASASGQPSAQSAGDAQPTLS